MQLGQLLSKNSVFRLILKLFEIPREFPGKIFFWHGNSHSHGKKVKVGKWNPYTQLKNFPFYFCKKYVAFLSYNFCIM